MQDLHVVPAGWSAQMGLFGRQQDRMGVGDSRKGAPLDPLAQNGVTVADSLLDLVLDSVVHNVECVAGWAPYFAHRLLWEEAAVLHRRRGHTSPKGGELPVMGSSVTSAHFVRDARGRSP